MTSDPARPPLERAFSEDAAHRLLARAVELDARRASQVTIAELREIAREAGIATEAFEEALNEMKAYSVAETSSTKLGRLRSLWDRVWNNDAGLPGAGRPGSRFTAITTNAIAFALFMILLRMVSQISRSLGGDWRVHAAGEVVANVLGIGIALRMRARTTTIVLGVTAAAQIAGFVMHLLFGIRTVQGGPTNWALMLAGLLGIGFGAMLAWHRKRPGGTVPLTATERADVSDQPAAGPAVNPPASLRLRTV